MRGQRHAPAAFYPRERPGTPCTGGWVGPRGGLDRCGKSRPYRDSIPRPFSPYPVTIPTTLPGPLFYCTVGKHHTIRNSAHRKPSTVFFNISSGTAIAEAVNLQHISTFGTCEDVRHFAQHSYNVTISSQNSQLTLYTDSHAS